jgi:putative ABC transport system substrate-binding protein
MMAAGVAMATPRALRARQKAMPVIGFLGVATADVYAPSVAAFQGGLDATGYIADNNVTIEFRWAENHVDRLPALAADLVARKVGVIMITGGTNGILAATGATATIPIVAITDFTPLIAAGLVASLGHPGGNLTGLSILVGELMAKRLEQLSELVPQARTIALLINPDLPNAWLGELQQAARAKGVETPILSAGTESGIDAAFASLVELRAGALLVGPAPFFNNRREQIVALAARHVIPTSYEWRESVAIGGLISYGPSVTDTWRQAGGYVGRILAGANPADLPIQQPTRFELVVNLKTAKALGVRVPPHILARADEVIE